jgi:hypothetical protein
MPSAEQRAHLAQLLEIHRRNLATLEMQAANYGGEGSAPLHIVNQIEAERDAIRRIEKQLDDHSASTKSR